MTKIQIVGHRGAAGLALENTMPSFEKAIEAGVKTIEFDVHTTKDGQFVICHNPGLKQVSGTDVSIKDLTWAELKKIPLHNNTRVPLLSEILDLARKHTLAVVVEVKAINNAEALCTLLDTYADLDIAVASFKYETLGIIRHLRPAYKLYLGDLHRPIAVLQEARALKAQGIDLHYMLINPLTYWLAGRWQMHIMLYTLNNRIIAKLISRLYPRVAICTDRPDHFLPQPHSTKKKKRALPVA